MKSMIRFIRSVSVAGAVVASAVMTPGHAEEAKTTVRAEIGKPIQAAQELLKAKKNKEALAKVREADAITGKTAYENYVVELTKGQAAAGAGEATTAAAAFEAAAAVAPANKMQLIAAAASQYYLAKNYAKAADLAERYKEEGGNDPAVQTVYVQSLYLAGKLPQAAKALRATIQAAESAGQEPTEQTLQMLADVTNRQKDNAGYIGALEKLVAYHPKRDYWLSLIYAVSTKQGLSDRLTLDVLRIKRATKALQTADEHVEGIQLALQAGFPFEASQFLDAGYEAKLLGQGPDLDRHKRLKDAVVKALAEDNASLGQDDGKARAAGGDMLMNTGFNYVLRGQTEKGLPMMEAAMTKGVLKRPDEARLHVGLAQIMAGQKARGIETLKDIAGKDGSAEIARLWMLFAQDSKKK